MFECNYNNENSKTYIEYTKPNFIEKHNSEDKNIGKPKTYAHYDF